MSRVKVYATGTCPYCVKAKALLDKLGIPYKEIRLDLDPGARSDFARETNSARTVPQIIIDGKCVGGYTELTELHMDGGLGGLVGQKIG
jgi:glutaredoxin 3